MSKIHYQDPVGVSVVQRGSEPIPNLDDTVSIHIGDITKGRVLVEVVTSEGGILMPQAPMSTGSVRSFEYQGNGFALHLVELHNYLAGDDYAEFKIGRVTEGDVSPSANDAGLTEAAKIERLIKTVAALEGAVFIRNGKEYTPAEAAEHMRNKWEWKAKDITTAEDFIRIAATKSSISGKSYMIRFDDGREVSSGAFLQEELDRLE